MIHKIHQKKILHFVQLPNQFPLQMNKKSSHKVKSPHYEQSKQGFLSFLVAEK
jgi:hypothetical protein